MAEYRYFVFDAELHLELTFCYVNVDMLQYICIKVITLIIDRKHQDVP